MLAQRLASAKVPKLNIIRKNAARFDSARQQKRAVSQDSRRVKGAGNSQDVGELCELLCSRIEQLRRRNDLAIRAQAAKDEDRAVRQDRGCMPCARHLKTGEWFHLSQGIPQLGC